MVSDVFGSCVKRVSLVAGSIVTGFLLGSSFVALEFVILTSRVLTGPYSTC